MQAIKALNISSSINETLHNFFEAKTASIVEGCPSILAFVIGSSICDCSRWLQCFVALVASIVIACATPAHSHTMEARVTTSVAAPTLRFYKATLGKTRAASKSRVLEMVQKKCSQHLPTALPCKLLPTVRHVMCHAWPLRAAQALPQNLMIESLVPQARDRQCTFVY